MPKMLVLLPLILLLHVVSVCCQNGGTNYRVVGFASNTSNLLQVNPDGSFKGFIWDMMNALKDSAGFTFTLSLQADGVYGTKPKADGSWDGMVGQLLANNVDIIAADFTITAERQAVIDFSMPFLSYKLVRVTRPGASLSGIKYAVTNDSADHVYLQKSVDSGAQGIIQNIQANAPTSLVKDDASGLALVAQGGWAYIGEDIPMSLALRASNGTFVVNGPALQRDYYGLGVRLGSPLARTLSINIAKLTENGQMQQLLRKWNLESATYTDCSIPVTTPGYGY